MIRACAAGPLRLCMRGSGAAGPFCASLLRPRRGASGCMNQARCAHIPPVPSKKEEPAADEQKHHKYTVPNAITMARIVATPYIGWLIFEQQFDAALLGARCARSAPSLPGWPLHAHTRS